MENGGSAALSTPSLTEITMADAVPTCESPGVPDSRPVEVLKLAQAGRFAMLYVSVCPSGSDPVGVNE
jgi:hypothetical protein